MKVEKQCTVHLRASIRTQLIRREAIHNEPWIIECRTPMLLGNDLFRGMIRAKHIGGSADRVQISI
jgi:hypothetical protein